MFKKFLKITGILVLVLGFVGFWGYNKYFKPDPEVQQELNDQFGADFFTFDETDHADTGDTGSSVLENTDRQSVNDSNSVKEKGAEQENGKTVIGAAPANETSNTKPETKLVIQDEISQKYEAQFRQLQSVALSRLDTLFSAAIQEYNQAKKAGTLNRAELAKKYIQAGTTLEANLDNQFYSVLSKMEAELKANNLPTDVVGVYKNEYEQAKSDKRAQLLGKVRL